MNVVLIRGKSGKSLLDLLPSSSQPFVVDQTNRPTPIRHFGKCEESELFPNSVWGPEGGREGEETEKSLLRSEGNFSEYCRLRGLGGRMWHKFKSSPWELRSFKCLKTWMAARSKQHHDHDHSSSPTNCKIYWLGWLTNTLLVIISLNIASSEYKFCYDCWRLEAWALCIDVWTHLNHLTRQGLTFIKPLLLSSALQCGGSDQGATRQSFRRKI